MDSGKLIVFRPDGTPIIVGNAALVESIKDLKQQIIDLETKMQLYKPLGVDQTWVDFSSTRVNNIDYTNDTGRSIGVYCSLSDNNGTTNYISIIVDGKQINSVSSYVNNPNSAVFAIVPPSSVYRCGRSYAGRGSLSWWELR